MRHALTKTTRYRQAGAANPTFYFLKENYAEKTNRNINHADQYRQKWSDEGFWGCIRVDLCVAGMAKECN